MFFGGIGRPGFRRIGRPGLIGLAARTAIVAGTASATVGAVNRHQANKARQQYEAGQYEQQQYVPVPAPAQEPAAPAAAPQAAPGGNDLVSRIKELGDLHESGVLTDKEFEAAKSKLLGI